MKIDKIFTNGIPIESSQLNEIVHAIEENNLAIEAIGPATNKSEFIDLMAEQQPILDKIRGYAFKSGTPHESVDLGLPSGTQWAKLNIGAKQETDYGDYFQFGSSIPNKQGVTRVANYVYNTAIEFNGTLVQNDTATKVWGNDWRLPTSEEMTELIENTDFEWCEGETAIGGVAGTKFMNKNDHSQYIFLPAGGYISNLRATAVGIRMYIMSSYASAGSTAVLRYYNGTLSRTTLTRSNAIPVRAVRKKNK